MTELTYRLNRGYWHWTCLKCGARGRERIPDQAYQERDPVAGHWCREETRKVVDGEGTRREVRVMVPIAPARWDRLVDGYRHNPGNPSLVVCPSCNGGEPFRFLLNIPIPPADGGDDGEAEPLASYQLLEEPWLSYARVALHFASGIASQDREDLIQDILVALIEVARERGGLSRGEMLMTARYARLAYFRDKGRRRPTLSLHHPIDDGDNPRELLETLADQRAIDLDAMLDARAQLRGCPEKVVGIAEKRLRGEALTLSECRTLRNYRVKGELRPAPDTGIGRFADLIAELVEQGWGSYRIWRELQAQGYQGSRSAVKYYLRGDKAKQERRESNRRRKQRLRRLDEGPGAALSPPGQPLSVHTHPGEAHSGISAL